MFGKEAENTTGQGSLNSILGQGCKVKGDIELQGTMRIDGQFECIPVEVSDRGVEIADCDSGLTKLS